jgi:hypothetical protein
MRRSHPVLNPPHSVLSCRPQSRLEILNGKEGSCGPVPRRTERPHPLEPSRLEIIDIIASVKT